MNSIDLGVLNVIQLIILASVVLTLLDGIATVIKIRINREDGFVFQIYADNPAELSPLLATLMLSFFAILYWETLTLTVILLIAVPITLFNIMLISFNEEMKKWEFSEEELENYHEIK